MSKNKRKNPPLEFVDDGKGKIKFSVIKRVLKYIFRNKKLVIMAISLMLLSNILSLIAPSLQGKAIDSIGKIAGKVNFQRVFYYCALMLSCYLLSTLFSFILNIVMIKLSHSVTYTMRREIFNHLMELPVSYFDTHAPGDIISKISYDVDTVNSSLSNDLLQICASIITVVGSFVWMVIISPVLLAVFLITVPISIIFANYKAKKIRPYFRARSGKLGMLNGYAEEMLSGHNSIKAYRREKVIVSRFDERNLIASDAYYEADYHGSIIGPTITFISNISLTLITVIGGILYFMSVKGMDLPSICVLTVGGISSFITYSRKFSGPINEIANIMSELQSSSAAAERIFKILDEKPETMDSQNAIIMNDVCGKVDINHVKFGYDKTRVIIHDLCLNAPPGSTIALVGPTGAGKTTIINLLMRFYDVDEGAIYVDDKNIYDITRSSLRGAYTMVLQDTWLFNGTVFENIAYGKQDATREEVIAAAKSAKIHNYIMGLPNGYDTVISDDGVNISKGQRQLITIARAMLPNTKMLILDEATSNVDSRTEIEIQDAMLRLMKGRTCFVIAHRLSTIKNADLILVVKDGDVVEQGTHEGLLQSGGVYATMYNSQFS